jgi:predicted AAA+ superfamily ATPase
MPAVRSALQALWMDNRFFNNRYERVVLFTQAEESLHPEIDHLIRFVRLPLLTVPEIRDQNIDYILDPIVRGGRGRPPRDRDSVCPEGRDLELARAAVGLPAQAIDDVLAASYLRHEDSGGYTPEAVAYVQDEKIETVNRAGLLAVHREPRLSLDDLKGLDNLREFCLRSLQPRPGRVSRAKGVVLLGPPGTGKTTFCQALGKAVGRKTAEFQVAKSMSKYVGETEGNVRRALETAGAMSPSILFIDEVDRGLAGGDGEGDGSGVMQHVMSILLPWLSDREDDVYVIASCNSVAALPPAFLRAGRFDATFMVDLPGPEARAGIWDLHRARYRIDPAAEKPADHGWTGAEIETCCSLADLHGTSPVEAARYVVPVCVSDADRIATLRSQAEGKYISASRPGFYRADDREIEEAAASGAKGRRGRGIGSN